MAPDKAGDRCDGGLRCAVRGLTAQLAAPQGFTLSIGGTLVTEAGSGLVLGHPGPRDLLARVEEVGDVLVVELRVDSHDRARGGGPAAA